ncbi:Heat shock protein hsp88 [Neolecta irregularis DAH-3]|uniref:Heat shock protein hsp88 n=1 Tax=Neolecta irregularis (strain DAH-3) TaxID=1198029 RepID=A0A1U7LTC4_NEOID|nr:Heat shock protein hsp88 [Neolecta irregularis DAH-3]|eukprot:OLL25920.1 Heat shock protein hsp88 [Neolecta irregularis DAH-3]
MSVVGIDLGNLNTCIAVARRGGIDVIVNETSNRATPSLVSFGQKNRYLGEPAKTQEISNYKNTVGSLKRLIGRRWNDPEVQIERKYIGAELVDVHGQVGAKVQYLNQEEVLTATQLVAALLQKVKQTTVNELKTAVSDVVISVPGWFTDCQRRAVLDAASIAGLNPLRLINDTTASALGYGITKTDLPDDKPRHVAIIDIGHSNYSVAIVAFKKGQLTVKSTAYDRHFGGRDFDIALIDHFAKEFKGKYNIDIKSNPKAVFRLAAAVEKLKKVLSANPAAPISIESIMNDMDVSSILKREELEEFVKPLLERVTVPLEQALNDSGLTKDDIYSVEMVGGATRVPCLKNAISNFFGKQLSFTLNQDEAVSRGAAFACAILSPAFKVREFAVHDISPYPICFTWEPEREIPDEETSLLVFPKNNLVPSTKVLTFYRKEPFTLDVSYTNDAILPTGTQPWIGTYTVKNVIPTDSGDFSIVKVKARINLHGIVAVESAAVYEEKEFEEEIPKAAVNEEKRNEDNNDPEVMDTEVPETRIVKKLVKKADLPIVAQNGTLSEDLMNAFKEREGSMAIEDKLVAETEDRKNALEEYLYDIRGKLEDIYAPFASEEEKSVLGSLLDDTENWLYDEGADTKKARYVSKMEEILKVAGPIRQRFFDAEEEKRQKIEEAQIAKRQAEGENVEQGTGGAAPPVPQDQKMEE